LHGIGEIQTECFGGLLIDDWLEFVDLYHR
jgi:hypothetical protein